MMFDDPHCGDHVFRTENSTTKQTISDISDNQFCEFLRAKHWRTRCVPFLTLVFIRHAPTTSAHQNAKHFDGWTTDSSNKLNDIQWHYTGFSMAQQGSPCLTPSFPRKKKPCRWAAAACCLARWIIGDALATWKICWKCVESQQLSQQRSQKTCGVSWVFVGDKWEI